MSEATTTTKRRVLVVENDENDILLVCKAFERAGWGKAIHSVRSGLLALAYLRGDAPYNDREKFPLPNLVLLDVRMPGMDGFEVLRWIRQQDSLAGLCVVVLTSADSIREATEAYQLGANSFLVKPLDFWNVPELMRSLEMLLAKKC